jgi:hypothetical protein
MWVEESNNNAWMNESRITSGWMPGEAAKTPE